MTTKFDIGQYKWFLITKGKFGPLRDTIDEIHIDRKGVTYRIGGHMRTESELFETLDEMLDYIRSEAKKQEEAPF